MLILHVGAAGRITANTSYGNQLHAHRKRIFAEIGIEGAAARFDSLQEVEVHKFLFRVLQKPQDLIEHTKL